MNDSERKDRGSNAPAWMQYSQNRPAADLLTLIAIEPLEGVDIVVYRGQIGNLFA